MVEKLKSYLIAFLLGAVAILGPLAVWLIKSIKPTINTASYVEKIENSIKKLKVNGESNTVDTVLSTSITPELEQPKRKKFLFIFNRKNLRK
jgi:hypothetical protein